LKARLEVAGRLAQLGERLVYTEDVGGSSPSSPKLSSVLPIRKQSGPWRLLKRPRARLLLRIEGINLKTGFSKETTADATQKTMQLTTPIT
jgi:hypothetical protein